ncbi:uncharacterized protein MONOS_17857 [Monocercomonoides exilis]|uniref:uncharacterized protein n=1 Tax=Monocercomonoides exilis TaxID=2049356 RepID=UPI00355A00A5|nr:hypothetical protein MONOS_17857 [Monocercomonoides exilis]
MKEINDKKEEEQRKTDLYSIATSVANIFIKDQLFQQGKTPEEMAELFCGMAESCTSKAPVRKIRWMKEDDDKLIQLYNEGKRATEMMKAFTYRDRQHIDYHLQVLLKKGKIKKPEPLPLEDIIEKVKQTQKTEEKKKTYKKRKPVDMDDEWENRETPTKRKRNDDEEEEENAAELEMLMKKILNKKKSKRLKRSEDGSEWVRVDDDSEEDVPCLYVWR